MGAHARHFALGPMRSPMHRGPCRTLSNGAHESLATPLVPSIDRFLVTSWDHLPSIKRLSTLDGIHCIYTLIYAHVRACVRTCVFVCACVCVRVCLRYRTHNN